MWRNAGRYYAPKKARLSTEARGISSQKHVCPDRIEQEEEGHDADEEEEEHPEEAQPSVLSISRRQPAFGVVRSTRATEQLSSALVHLQKARDIAALQQFFTEHACKACESYPQSLWRVLDAVLDQSKACQDRVLESVLPLLSAQERKVWPRRRAYIDNKLNRTLGTFHARVTRIASIDLSHFKFHGLEDPIQFEFLDPVFAWAVRADKLIRNNIKFHFDYSERHHPVHGVPLYGASVANGLLLKRACAKLPTLPNEYVPRHIYTLRI